MKDSEIAQWGRDHRAFQRECKALLSEVNGAVLNEAASDHRIKYRRHTEWHAQLSDRSGILNLYPSTGRVHFTGNQMSPVLSKYAESMKDMEWAYAKVGKRVRARQREARRMAKGSNNPGRQDVQEEGDLSDTA